MRQHIEVSKNRQNVTVVWKYSLIRNFIFLWVGIASAVRWTKETKVWYLGNVNGDTEEENFTIYFRVLEAETVIGNYFHFHDCCLFFYILFSWTAMVRERLESICNSAMWAANFKGKMTYWYLYRQPRQNQVLHSVCKVNLLPKSWTEEAVYKSKAGIVSIVCNYSHIFSPFHFVVKVASFQSHR